MDEEFQHGIELPELWELESFFECEADLAEPDEHWLNNHAVSFTRASNGSKLTVMLTPMHSDAGVRFEADRETTIDLQLSYVTHVEVVRDTSVEQLKLSFWPQTCLKPLVLQVRPRVQIHWSMKLA